MDSFAFLERAGRADPEPVYALSGDEDFLKRQVLRTLQQRVLGNEANSFSLSTHPGDRASFATVHDELETLPFLSPRRLVVIENADPFVTRHRAVLEKYVSNPSKTGVLVLDVKSWPSNTRLAKMLGAASSIVCKGPAAYKLPDWCVQWSASHYGKRLSDRAAALLIELVGADMGQLDQELNKLAVYVEPADRIEADDVDQLVGRSREETTWRIFDAIGGGQAGQALAILDRLFDQGEDALRVLGAFSMQLRRLAQAARLSEQGVPVAVAMERVGVPPFVRQGFEQQLRHLGRHRAGKLYDWLLDTDLGLKGSSQLPPRTLLERLVIRLARKN